jgi:hypothetical protein
MLWNPSGKHKFRETQQIFKQYEKTIFTGRSPRNPGFKTDVNPQPTPTNKKRKLLHYDRSLFYLKNFIGSGWMLIFFDDSENPEDFVNDFSGDETAEAQVHVLHERHRQQRNPEKMSFFL